MTRDKDFKRLVRARASATGERYTAARRSLLRLKGGGMVRVTCKVKKHEQEPERLAWVILSEDGGERTMSFSCLLDVATSIAVGLDGHEGTRPLTHDLLRDVVGAMGTAREVRVTEVRDKTIFAELVITDSKGEERVVDCRPSDGIAFAVRAGIPILVNESLMVGRDTMDA